MTRFIVFMDYAAGPLITLIVIALTHLLAPFVSLSLGLALVAIVWTAFIGGALPAAVSAGIVIVYMAYAYPPDYGRMVQGMISAVALAAMVSYLKHHARLSQSLNGNLRRLKEAVELTRQLQLEWADLSDQGRWKRIELLNDRLGNLAALVYGWHAIRREMDQTQHKLGMDDKE